MYEYKTPGPTTPPSNYAPDAQTTAGAIGCGVGRVTSYLNERGPDVQGIDLSPEMIATARLAHPTWPLT